jgi:CBS domain-containing protein
MTETSNPHGNAKRECVNGFSVSFNRLELKDYVESLAVVVHMYKEILNVDAAFGIFTDQERNRCMIIGRSEADGIDIGRLPVVDNEKIIGILTRSDTMLYFYDLLPD